MRHYDRAEIRHLNDGERYRDYDFLAEGGWPPAPEPPSTREPESSAAVAPTPAQAPPLWRTLLTALMSPRKTLRRALRRTPG